MKCLELKVEFVFIFFFWPILQKLGILPCSNIHRRKGLSKTFQNQSSYCAKTSWNYDNFRIEIIFFFIFWPIVQALGILPCSNGHR